MTLRQTRDIEFTITDGNDNPVKLLIGLYNTPGGFTGRSLWLSVATDTGGWEKMIDYPVTDGQFNAYTEDEIVIFLRRFVDVVNRFLARFGVHDPIEIPDEDPDMESREELWVRLMNENLTIEDNQLTVRPTD